MKNIYSRGRISYYRTEKIRWDTKRMRMK